jgi:pyruvate kinase
MLNTLDFSGSPSKYEHRVTKTQIVCTIGPPTNNKETLMAMMKAGMTVARLNFSHGTHEV